MSEAKKPSLTPAQQALSDLWDEHLQHEFATKDPAQTIDTMVKEAYVNHVPVLTGGSGRKELRAFYTHYFIPQMPPDMVIVPVSRTIGNDRLVDESVAKFTHTLQMDWLLPGLAPTGKRVEVALVVVVEFRDGKLAGERIYWDQASVLVQLGRLDAAMLPVAGVESARKVLDPTIPSNQLIVRATLGRANH
jgi:carboxymethylenebutenolidase